MVSNFRENNPHGLTIFINAEKGEKLLIMENNNVVKTITDPKEIENKKSGLEYEDLKTFYDSIPQLYDRMINKK